ncbi:MAG: hypothetical protein KF752_03175 [Pirellulaceae bacterium]|nr:hypothetical protein [Pirellulaceae bacterium]
MSKRLHNRLDRLEKPAGPDLSQSDRLLLVSILGRRDALFWPWRWQIGIQPPMTEIRRRQREYLSGVSGVAVHADGKRQWKNSHSARQRLIGAKMVTATHSSGQVTSMFLTPLGEAYARSLVGGLETVESALPVIQALRMLSEATSVAAVRESVLFNRDCVGNPEDWSHLTELVLPFLTSGMVTCHSDTQGRIAYTPQEVEPPAAIAVDVAVDPEADRVYFDGYESERNALETAEPRGPTEVFIPLPATGWGWPCYYPGCLDEEI